MDTLETWAKRLFCFSICCIAFWFIRFRNEMGPNFRNYSWKRFQIWLAIYAALMMVIYFFEDATKVVRFMSR